MPKFNPFLFAADVAACQLNTFRLLHVVCKNHASNFSVSPPFFFKICPEANLKGNENCSGVTVKVHIQGLLSTLKQYKIDLLASKESDQNLL